MKKTPFDSFTDVNDAHPMTPVPITLPRDALRKPEHCPDHPAAHFPGGHLRYEKTFVVPAAQNRLTR